MHKHVKQVSWMSTCAMASLFVALSATAASADTAPPPAPSAAESTGVGDIVVTARKKQESSNSIGMSINALTGDTLAKQGIVDTADLVKAVPGFNYTRSTYGTPVYTLRGIGFNETTLAAAPPVSVYVDEVPLPYSIMTQGAALDVQRVEVLKGPQGTLFGQNSTGGAINYIAAKPTKTLQAGADVTYGRFDTFNGSAFLSGPITDTLRGRIAVRRESSGPWQQSATRPGDRTGGTDRTQGRMLLDWDASNKLTFELNANGWLDRSTPQAGQYVGLTSTKAPAVVANSATTAGNDQIADWDANTHFYTHDSFYQLALRTNYELGTDLNLTAISAYEKLNRDTLVDADGLAVNNFSAGNKGYIKSFSQEIRLAGKYGQAVSWMVGGNYQNDATYDTFSPQATYSSFPFKAATAMGHNQVNTYAAFANADWQVTPKLSLTGGARYTYQYRDYVGCLFDSGAGDLAAVVAAASTKLSGTTTTIAPGSCVTISSSTYKPAYYEDSLNQGNVSWKGGANWEVAPHKLLYASISKGYKNGVFITTGATFAAQLAPATQESVLAYETGFKFSLLNRTLQLNGAAFYYDYRNKQIRGRVIDPVLGGLNRLINIPKSRIAGAELQLVWEPVKGLSINAGGTYVGSKILGDFTNYTPTGAAMLMSGEAFPLTPKWQFTGDIGYDHPISATFNAFAGASATYQSATNSALGAQAEFAVKAYTLVDLRAGVHTADDKWRFSAFVHNLGNSYYWTNVSYAGPDVAVRYAGMPRTYGVSASWRFQ
jgi:iron complex outermembrane recepter protein